MAEKTEGKSKRRVKNPETFRERAIKATEESDKPARSHKLRSGFWKYLVWLMRPIGRLLRFLFYRQPFKFFGRILLPRYVRNSWQELRQVKWPGWRESRKLTVAVLIFAIIFGLAIAGLDWVLDKVFKQLLV